MRQRDILDHRQRRAADVMQAQITRDPNAGNRFRNSDGTYNIRDIRTNAIVRAVATREYSEGAWVDVECLGASGRTIGGAYRIIDVSAGEKRGATGIPMVRNRRSQAPIVLGIDPNPVVLTIGGAAVAATITGSGFDATTELEYGDASITDASAPVFDDEEIAVSLQASALGEPGLYTLEVNGTPIDEAIKLISGDDLIRELWLSADFQTVAGVEESRTNRLYRLNADTLGIEATITGNAGGASTSGYAAAGVAQIGTKVHAIFGLNFGGESEIITADRATNVSSLADVLLPVNVTTELEANGSELVACASNAPYKLARFMPDGTGLTTVKALTNGPVGTYFDAAHYYLSRSGADSSRVTPDGLTETTVGARGQRCVEWGGKLYFSDSSNSQIDRVDKATFALEGSLVCAGFPVGLVVVGKYLYAGCLTGDVVRKFDLDTNLEVASLAIATGPRWLATDGVNLWVSCTGSRTVVRVDLATFTVAATSAVIGDATYRTSQILCATGARS